MKRQYEAPELEIIDLTSSDIITASGGDMTGDDGDYGELGW